MCRETDASFSAFGDALPCASRILPCIANIPFSLQQGWGLSFMITQEPGATGRGRNTAWWAGEIP